MPYLRFSCGCERDVEGLSSAHVSGPQQSAGDRGRKLHHYPVGLEPASWCISCAADRPCRCDVQPKAKQKGKAKR